MKTIKENYSKSSDDSQSKPLWVCMLDCSYLVHVYTVLILIMQVKQVIFDMQELVTSMLTDMQNHLTVFNLKSADDLLQIKHMIQYVCMLCSTQHI